MDMIGKNLETLNLLGEHFSFSFLKKKEKKKKESLWSPICFFPLQTGRRGRSRGVLGGFGIRKQQVAVHFTVD